jgi:4,5-dihydroxyphthalate decarboxylase
VPSHFQRRDPRVKRLFPDVVGAERAYFAATGIFPIMHVVVIRRDVYERHRWVAQSLYKAFVAARDDAYGRIYDSSALRFMTPWLIQEIEQARDLFGADYWSYGVRANQDVLATFLRYHHEQGLSHRLREPEAIFAPESLEAFVI